MSTRGTPLPYALALDWREWRGILFERVKQTCPRCGQRLFASSGAERPIILYCDNADCPSEVCTGSGSCIEEAAEEIKRNCRRELAQNQPEIEHHPAT